MNRRNASMPKTIVPMETALEPSSNRVVSRTSQNLTESPKIELVGIICECCLE